MYEFEVEIGRKENLCSSYRMPQFENIYENFKEYWIHNVFMGNGMKIHKETKEGITLTKLIENKTSENAIFSWLEKVYFQKFPRKNLYSLCMYIRNDSYTKGRNDKVKEFHKVLELEDYYG